MGCVVSQPRRPSAGRRRSPARPKAASSASAPHSGSRSSSCFLAVARPWGRQQWPCLRKEATLPRPLLGSAQPRSLTPCPAGARLSPGACTAQSQLGPLGEGTWGSHGSTRSRTRTVCRPPPLPACSSPGWRLTASCQVSAGLPGVMGMAPRAGQGRWGEGRPAWRETARDLRAAPLSDSPRCSGPWLSPRRRRAPVTNETVAVCSIHRLPG